MNVTTTGEFSQQPIGGKALDLVAANFDLRRRRLWWTLWLVRESDRSLRCRVHARQQWLKWRA